MDDDDDYGGFDGGGDEYDGLLPAVEHITNDYDDVGGTASSSAAAAASSASAAFIGGTATTTARGKRSSALVCECGSTRTFSDHTKGTTTCAECYMVLEENAIVAEMTFQESAGGGTRAVGSFLSAAAPRALSLSAKQSGVRYGKESREATLSNGRKAIQRLIGTFGLRGTIVDSAMRTFTLAVEQNFIQGRKTQNVVAACVYMACRQENPPTPLFLIDFSDVLSTNVFILGSTLMKLCRVLKCRLPTVDPAVYIERFASQLDFGPDLHKVSETAMRLVSQMKQDWLATGRRPAGVCGACLLIAARMHGFKRSHREVIDVVKVCDATIRKRLQEFEMTTASSMTVNEFNVNDYRSRLPRADPPAFRRADHHSNNHAGANNNYNINGQYDHGGGGGVKHEPQPSFDEDALQRDMADMEKVVEEKIASKRLLSEQKRYAEQNAVLEAQVAAAAEASANAAALGGNDDGDDNDDDDNDDEDGIKASTRSAKAAAAAAAAATNKKDKEQVAEKDAAAADDDDERLSDLDDMEIDMVICSEEEVVLKQKLWNNVHREYLDREAEKRRTEEMHEANGGPPKAKRGRKKREDGGAVGDGGHKNDASHAQRLSSRINPDAFRDLFGDDEPILAASQPAVAVAAAAAAAAPSLPPAVAGAAAAPAIAAQQVPRSKPPRLMPSKRSAVATAGRPAPKRRARERQQQPHLEDVSERDDEVNDTPADAVEHDEQVEVDDEAMSSTQQQQQQQVQAEQEAEDEAVPTDDVQRDEDKDGTATAAAAATVANEDEDQVYNDDEDDDELDEEEEEEEEDDDELGAKHVLTHLRHRHNVDDDDGDDGFYSEEEDD